MQEDFRPKPVVLLILDGWGISPAWGGNALSIANVKNYNKLWRECPHAILQASGEAVGLPRHDIGNSEVGHLHIGAGRILAQDLSRINQAIENKSFVKNPTILKTIEYAKKNNSNLHLLGLVSDGGVHSHIDHLLRILDICKEQNFSRVFIHAITDGRDTSPMSALSFIEKIQKYSQNLGVGQIATIMGRYYAMDRNNHWSRTAQAYFVMTRGIGKVAQNPMQAISKAYAQGINDEFIQPAVIIRQNRPITLVSNNDAMIFFNFRSDRARQITKAFTQDDFKEFHRGKKISNLFFASMLPYEKEYKGKVYPVFQEYDVKNSLAEMISKNQLNQFHIAETEKYAHITYFLNGGREKPFPKEERLLIPSPQVTTYDQKPEMSAGEITEKVLENLKRFDFIAINFANPDMVGHSGNQDATIKALEFVDNCLSKISSAILEAGGVLIITADHGNAEELLNPETGEPATEHTQNPVPFILITPTNLSYQIRRTGEFVLANIAPTILEIMHIPKPVEMTATSLIENGNNKNNNYEQNPKSTF